MEKKILIINVNWVGDVLFSTPFIRAVREAHPDSYIACLVHPRCVEMLDANPRINEIVIYDEEGVHRGLLGKLQLIASLRKKRFDKAFILHRSFTKALVAMLSGIPERIGYPTKNRSMLLTKVVEEPTEELHKVEYFLNIAKATGIEIMDKSYEFFIRDDDRESMKKFLSESGIASGDKLVVLCPGGNWDPKRWSKENFALLADKIIERFDAKVVITGARKDITLAEAIKNLMKRDGVIASGKMTLKQLGALFERANLVIANDTGPMHIAVSMKAKTIALFGPTSPDITGPCGRGNYKVIYKNETCVVPCYDVTCKKNSCMDAIKVEDVFKEAERMLSDK